MHKTPKSLTDLTDINVSQLSYKLDGRKRRMRLAVEFKGGGSGYIELTESRRENHGTDRTFLLVQIEQGTTSPAVDEVVKENQHEQG